MSWVIRMRLGRYVRGLMQANRGCGFYAVALGCVLLFSSPIYAQQDTGTITGRVSDASGAVIPEANVRVTNVGTNISLTVVTDGSGYFAATPLKIGTYRLEVEKKGFKKVLRDGIVLNVQDHVRVDFELQLGSVSEVVEVNAVEPLLQTQTSSLGQVVQTRSITDLPLNGRSYIQLITLAPGTFVPQNSNTLWKGQFVAINGNRQVQNSFILDGTNNNTTDNSNPAIIPPPDAIAEFKVQTNTMAAEFGRSAGGVINVSIKSGTNLYHGDLYEFLRNSALDSNDFFNSGRMKPSFRQNQFGGTLGGPIIHNRTFFFVSYQGTRVRKGQTTVGTMPNLDERAGDFSRDAAKIFDPFTSSPNTGGVGYRRDPFPGNVIPASRFSGVATKLIPHYPAPNVAGQRVLNYVGILPFGENADEVDTRVDHQFSSKDSFFARASVNQQHYDQPGILPNFPDGSMHLPVGDTPGRGASAGYTHIFSPNLINEFRAGFARLRWYAGVFDPSVRGADVLGIPGVPFTSQTLGYPQFSISGVQGLGDGTMAPVTRGKNTFDYLDNISYIKGNHQFKAGVEFRRTQFNINQPAGPRGAFTFNGIFTRQPYASAGTGIAFADFLLGYADNASIAYSGTVGIRQHPFSTFLMDDWKVTNRLTLNLGVRYELIPPPFEVCNRFVSFDFPTGQIVLAKPGNYRDKAFTAIDKNNFAPRVGLAYSLRRNTVVRAAYGIFYDFEDNAAFQPAHNYPFRSSLVYKSDQVYPSTAIRLDTGFPTAALTQYDPTAQLWNTTYQMRPAYTQQWNFSLQHQIGTITLNASYVGNKGTHLATQLQTNQPVPGSGAIQPRRPYPGYGQINTTEPIGVSSYNGLLLSAEKRVSSGLTFLASYTYSKALEDSGSPAIDSVGAAAPPSPQDPRNLRGDWGLSPHDVQQRFVLSYVYDLPFGKGKRFLTGAPVFVNAVLGGWQMNGVTTLQSGRYFTAGYRFDASNTGATGPRADIIGSPNLPKSERTLQRWIDTSAFAEPAPYTYGNAGRNNIEGPGQVNFDFSFFKTFVLNRDTSGSFKPNQIEFRAELFNGLNTPQFQNPNRSVGTPQFGSITDVVNSQREIQFALKFIF